MTAPEFLTVAIATETAGLALLVVGVVTVRVVAAVRRRRFARRFHPRDAQAPVRRDDSLSPTREHRRGRVRA